MGINSNNVQGFNIESFFDDYLKAPDIFTNRDALSASFIPCDLPHRDMQIQEIAQITACTLKNSNPSNLFLYGKTGTGKTAVIKHVSKKLTIKCKEIGIKPPKWVYINCKQVKSSYRTIAKIHNEINPEDTLPPTGLPSDVMIERLLKSLEEKVGNSNCFIVLDEIDGLKSKKSKDNILYILSRINESLHTTKVSVIGISNVLNFKDDLDSRVISSLCEEEIVFPAYNAVELFDILNSRVKLVFKNGIVTEGALRVCAALAAKENGDARRALALLRKAAELVERRSLKNLSEEHIYLAQEMLDRDKVTIFIKELPIQQKIILLSIYLNYKFRDGKECTSGEVYSTYSELQKRIFGLSKLTTRRVADLAKELDLAGITESKLKSFGRKGGRTRMIAIKTEETHIIHGLKGDSRWEQYLNYKPMHIERKDINIYDGNKYKSLM